MRREGKLFIKPMRRRKTLNLHEEEKDNSINKPSVMALQGTTIREGNSIKPQKENCKPTRRRKTLNPEGKL